MPEAQVALYARVSSDQQARGNTIASQVAAVREPGGSHLKQFDKSI
jgi:DNA invertase Pin-like site-specific DNA recombinase